MCTCIEAGPNFQFLGLGQRKMDRIGCFYGYFSDILDWKQLQGGKKNNNNLNLTNLIQLLALYFNKLTNGSLFLILQHFYQSAARARGFGVR